MVSEAITATFYCTVGLVTEWRRLSPSRSAVDLRSEFQIPCSRLDLTLWFLLIFCDSDAAGVYLWEAFINHMSKTRQPGNVSSKTASFLVSVSMVYGNGNGFI